VKSPLDSGMQAMREMRREDAERAFREALALAKGDERLHARALARLLYALASQGRAHELARAIGDAVRAHDASGTDEVARLVLTSCLLRFVPLNHAELPRMLDTFVAKAARHPDDLDVARAAREVAIVCSGRADYATAVRLLEAAARVLGADDPEYAMTLFNLADARAALAGSYDAVMPELRRVIAIQEASLAPRHFEKVMPLATLGLALARKGELPEARSSLQRALEIAVEVEGEQGRTPARIRAELQKLAA
jgi:tetratricopeptide (TPR) repeat protein